MSSRLETELHSFFENTLKPHLCSLEKIRRRKLHEGIGFALLIVGLSALLAFQVFAGSGSGILIFQLLILGVAVVFAYFMLIYWVERGLSDFKPQIIEPLVRHINPNFRYFPYEGIKQDRFMASGLFDQRVHSYHSEDLIKGTLGETTFSFSEVHAEKKVRSGSNTSMEDIFRGFYFIADFNKNFSSQTWVFPDRAEHLLGSFVGNLVQSFRAQLSADGDLIKLEDPDFEKLFSVYSTHPIEARYILTPALMRRMLAMAKMCGVRPYFSFLCSSVHIAIPTHENRFEPHVFGTLVNFEMVRSFSQDILMLSGFVEAMDLNTRIWSKDSEVHSG